jgi:hypothetical protein
VLYKIGDLKTLTLIGIAMCNNELSSHTTVWQCSKDDHDGGEALFSVL